MRRLTVLMVVAFMCAMLCVVALPGASAAKTEREIDTTSSATPNYRTFMESDLKDMPLVGGHYTCQKSSDPYTYFEQDWRGVDLSYLLETEVGIKDDTSAIKIIAEDGYSTTMTLDQIRGNGNPRGLPTLLGWKNAEPSEDNPNAPDGAGAPWVTPLPTDNVLDTTEGPFRIVMPQNVEGPAPENTAYDSPAGTGTKNWNKSVKWVRAIEVQPVPTGLPAIDAESIPSNEVIVYGNILNRKTYTVDQLKSIRSYTSTYHWKNKADVEGDTEFTGIPADYLIDNVYGLQDTATSVMNYASDGWGFKDEWTLDEIRDTYANGNKFMYAWMADGVDLQPDPGGDGPIEFIKPQFDPDDTNTSKWLKWTRNISVMPDDDNPRLDDAKLAAMPTDRVIATGSIDAGNVPSYWYFAEGYTGGGFEEWLCIENVNSWETKVIIEYQIEGEGTQQQELQVAPRSRTTVRVNDVVGDNKNVSATVEGYHGDSIVAERAMYWNGRDGGHCAAGVTEPATDWYLAEGCTSLGFETWILVQNPGDEQATVGFTYMTADGEEIGPAFELDGHSRKTICVADVLNDEVQVSTRVHSDQPVIAERAMYWNDRAGGHCATGTPDPGTEWYLAEGSTAGGFETWVLVQNPNENAAQVTVTYMNEGGEQAGPVVDLPANSRASINVADTLQNDWSVSTKLESDQPIVAERAMYWNSRKGGHCEHAVDSPKFRHYLAEGATAGGFETWVLVQNPGTVDATVNITYLTGEGAVMRDPVQVPAGTRVSLNVADTVPDNYQVSTQINSSAPVAVERAVYWNSRIEGSCANGYSAW